MIYNKVSFPTPLASGSGLVEQTTNNNLTSEGNFVKISIAMENGKHGQPRQPVSTFTDIDLIFDDSMDDDEISDYDGC